MNDVVLSVRNLSVAFGVENPVCVTDNVSFDVRRGEFFALVGESGCGKSVTAMSLLGLLPRPSARARRTRRSRRIARLDILFFAVWQGFRQILDDEKREDLVTVRAEKEILAGRFGEEGNVRDGSRRLEVPEIIGGANPFQEHRGRDGFERNVELALRINEVRGNSGPQVKISREKFEIPFRLEVRKETVRVAVKPIIAFEVAKGKRLEKGIVEKPVRSERFVKAFPVFGKLALQEETARLERKAGPLPRKIKSFDVRLCR